MENTNKPQWLIDAENEIKKFENSKYGKMNNQQLAASVISKNNDFGRSKNVFNPQSAKGIKKDSTIKSKISNSLKGKKTANHVYVRCSDGFITTKPSAAVYCNSKSLNFNDCTIIENFKIEDLYVHILNLLPNEFRTQEVTDINYHAIFTNFIKYCIESNLVIDKIGRKGFYKKI